MEKLLSFEEVRVIGSLIEKGLTTPEYYPLTVNSLTNACNQKSNREPVVSFDQKLVEDTLEELRAKTFVSRVTGSDIRVAKYRQIFTEELKLTAQEIAVLCVLMLRGAQTIGEIKGRSGRLFNFGSLEEVDSVLQDLINREQPYVTKLPRQAGRKEPRYAHLFCGEPEVENELQNNLEEQSSEKEERIQKLEEELEAVKSELEELKQSFAEFKKQFE